MQIPGYDPWTLLVLLQVAFVHRTTAGSSCCPPALEALQLPPACHVGLTGTLWYPQDQMQNAPGAVMTALEAEGKRAT